MESLPSFKLLDAAKKELYRNRYIQLFIDTKSEYYLNSIRPLKKYTDGYCYYGYLWDCFKNKEPLKYYIVLEFVKNKENILVFWDIHSVERQYIPEFARNLPKDTILQMDGADLPKMLKNLQEDLYITDDTFTWTAVLTHSTLQGNISYGYLIKEIVP